MTAGRWQSRLARSWAPLTLIVLVAGGIGTAAAQAQDRISVELREIGFRGAFKVGSWVPIRLRIRAADRPVTGRVRIEVPDGDGVITAWTSPNRVELGAGETTELLTYAKPGKLYGDLQITFIPSEATAVTQVFRSGRASEGDFSQGLVQGRRLIALVGAANDDSSGTTETVDDPTGLEALGSRRSSHLPVVAVLRSPDALPDRAIGYESLDALVLALGGDVKLDTWDAARLKALEQWVRTGGRLVVAIGSETANQRAGHLGPLMADALEGMAQTGQLRGLEAYCDTGQPINVGGQIPLSRLSRAAASVPASQGNLPLVVRNPYGFGTVTVLAFDVTQPPFSTWTARSDLWRRLLELSAPDITRSAGGRLTNLRINDLATQLYAVLGQFKAVRLVPFGIVALLVFAYLLIAGPGDFFLVGRLLGRVELTWLTFSLIILAITAAGLFAAGRLKGDRLRMNKIDLIDVDVATGTLRGTSCLTLFSPRIDTFDLRLVPGEFGSAASADDSESPPPLLSWLGVPEDTIGGMYKQSGVRLLTRAYRYGEEGSSLENVPIETWSTKSFLGRWTRRIEAPLDHELEAAGPNELRGGFTLRLDAPLEDCLLAFGDRAYTLETLHPHEPARFTGQYTFRSLNGLLTNKTLVGQEIQSERYDRSSYAWDPLVRMMQFHRAAGGQSYTDLEHAYLGSTDLSHLLELGRAILVGSQSATAGSRVQRDGKPLDEQAETNERTYWRFVLPVSPRTTPNSRGTPR